jgi:hypothetical protein
MHVRPADVAHSRSQTWEDEYFSAQINVTPWQPGMVVTLDFGSAATVSTLTAVHAATILSRNGSAYMFQLAEWDDSNFGFNGQFAGSLPTPNFLCDDSQFHVPYCPNGTWHVYSAWPGGAEVELALLPWSRNGVLEMSLPPLSQVRGAWCGPAAALTARW